MRGIIRLNDKSHWVSLFDPLLPLLVFLAFSVCFSPYPFLFHLHSFLLFVFSASPYLFLFHHSFPCFFLILVQLPFLFFFSVSLFLFLLISIHMPSFYSLSLFLSSYIFISMSTVPSILLLFFSAHVCKLRMFNVFAWVEYGRRMVGQAYYYYIDCNFVITSLTDKFI